jgi:DNA polymerase-3 subunit epsilon
MNTILPLLEKAGTLPDDVKAAIVALLETPNDIKVFHRLLEPKVYPPTPGMRRVAFLDTETTGVNTSEDEMVELGYVIMEFDDHGHLGNVISIYNELNQPVLPITNTNIHGISDDMVEGKAIDFAVVTADMEAVNLVVAHNSGFDRKIIERYCPIFETIPWACSYKDINWKEQGATISKLEYLAYISQFFYDAHRAIIDVYAMIEIIRRLDIFKQLVLAAMKSQYILSAQGSPFSKKDILKERGYKPLYVAGKFVCWYTSVDEANLNVEKNWLLKDGGCRHVPVREVNSMDRYSIREET